MKLVHFVLIALIFVVTSVYAADCPNHFAGGQPPKAYNQKLLSKSRMLCNQGYSVLHSGLTRTPLWSAEYIFPTRMEMAKGQPRVNNFQPDMRIPSSERAELQDFARSGFDRGHMAPSADMPTPESQNESFLLSNMIPQDPDNNRYLHNGIESAVRKEARERPYGLYVVTGPIFRQGELRALKGRVAVPDGIYKCVYDPKKQEAGCFVESNAPGMEYNALTVAQVGQIIGFDLFPAMPDQAKNSLMKLPKPSMYKNRKKTYSFN